ncbi:SHOCT domain-containing protein [Nocardia sp. NPDC004568]|uniref:SHOCT domain-containing protein n=1 Tax=Nocardia sp. NPDC004568 TaxID=3154551 RepID=UPI0033A6F8BD
MSGWGIGLMAVGTILFWALVVSGSVLLVRYMASSASLPPRGWASPRQVLAERYARGEITDDEYARRMKVLDSHPDV